MITQKTVNDMYTYTKTSGAKLLSEYESPFWSDYINNSTKYDSLFRRMFYSFRYFMQDADDTIETITANFTSDVYNHLLINDKKYAELYRVHVIPDEDYSITDNYNVTEKMDKDISHNDSDIFGDRTDTTTDILGAKTDSSTTIIGSRSDVSETNIGEQTNKGTDTIAGFNSSNFSNDTQVTNVLGAKTDKKTDTIGEQTNTAETTSGSQSNTYTFQKSNQTDTHNGTGKEEYTLTRVGNIGVKTVTAVMEEHTEFWSKWEFYSMIFGEICAELLMV